MTATDTTVATDNALAGVLPERTIRPRTRGYTHMSIAAATHSGIIDEQGELHTDAVAYVRAAEPTAFITLDPSAFLAELDYHYCEHPHWRYTLARIVRRKATSHSPASNSPRSDSGRARRRTNARTAPYARRGRRNARGDYISAGTRAACHQRPFTR
jgi:hypothetical protein